MDPDTALIVCRFLHDAATMLLFGAFAYLAGLVPRQLSLSVGARLGSMRVVAAAVAVATSFAFLPLETATIGDGFKDAVDLGILGDVLFGTTFGMAWAIQAGAAVLLLATLPLRLRLGQAATAVAACGLLACLSLTGHAVMQTGWIGLGHRLNDALHVLAGGAWLGALAALPWVLRGLGNAASRDEAVLALKRFSDVGHGVVALVLLSGVANAALISGRWPFDWSNGYERLLSIKIAVVATMVAIAIFNRYGVVPRLARDPKNSVLAIQIGTFVEIVLGLAAIGLVATFGTLSPQLETGS